MSKSIEVRDADYLRAVFVGTLHGLVKRHQWNAQQAAKALGASEIQVFTSRRAWQQWERGERRMHLAFWELAHIKIRELEALPDPSAGLSR